ncbi:DNA methyltransferase [Ureaplasma canigenitalium]|uniref:DNA methyltransferase n=1 Tax=Ureaplasma canigenitalium TaxID=42092 RepID=UPI000AE32687|nr:site-specific DNA-methyltransferase [Ureaplasma canigenitalium]
MDLKETLLNLLKGDEKYYSTEQNKLLLGNIFVAVNNHDSDFFKLLFHNELMKRTFFSKVDDFWIFNDQKFIDFINLKDFMPDSFTSFKNKIGLVDNKGDFLSEKSDVVLSFPYKDCLLVGSQDKDDQKSTEVMLNETLALDYINHLLQPKVFVNMKRYSKEKVDENITFNEKDNLIIKGNNLIALSSILSRFRGKVKCICIDPPYNTGNDSFNYNDKFNHSTWLTFMKNRLELAKKLLRDDGVIFVNLDHNEVHYCKVLMDSIFGRENFVNEIIWRYRTYIGQVKMFFPKKHDNILWYKKKNITFFNQTNVGNYEDTPDYKRWKQYLNNDGEIIYGNHPITDSRFTAYLRKYISQFGEPKNGDVIYKNCGYVVDDVWEDIIALDAKNKTERIELFSGSGQKPEALIERILNSTTQPNDLVLDFHLGSGTTAAVAHKMNRQYIGIEQMDYIESVTVERLKKVIEGEQGGISKMVNWNGGGSFVYCELAKKSQKWIDLIAKAT